jgi:serine protease Do
MSKNRSCLALLMLVGGEASGLEPPAIFERVAPSVWVVSATSQGRQITASAVVVAPGRLMTNCHVVRGAKAIQVKKDNTQFDAALEFSDEQRDLCQLVVRNFFAPALPLAPMGTLKVGQRVYAINSPGGEELSINEGMVSSVRKATDGSPLIQTTVAVTHGSSGGGLFDAEARLVGITTYAASQGPTTNFAQPADWIQDVPERATTALAARAPTPAASPYPRQLTGEELADHFRNAGRVDVVAPPSLRSLNFAGNRISITYLSSRDPSGFSTNGSFQVRPDGQVCFTLPPWPAGYDVGWKWMSDCFRVSQTDAKTYSLKNLKGDSSFSYAVR